MERHCPPHFTAATASFPAPSPQALVVVVVVVVASVMLPDCLPFSFLPFFLPVSVLLFSCLGGRKQSNSCFHKQGRECASRGERERGRDEDGKTESQPGLVGALRLSSPLLLLLDGNRERRKVPVASSSCLLFSISGAITAFTTVLHSEEGKRTEGLRRKARGEAQQQKTYTHNLYYCCSLSFSPRNELKHEFLAAAD